MTKPILLAVHDDDRDRQVLQRALTTRYSDGYQIPAISRMVVDSPRRWAPGIR
jgi:hypothetical protein